MQSQLRAIIYVDYSCLKKSKNEREILTIKEAISYMTLQEFCEKYLHCFSDVAQTRILCLKLDYMLHTTTDAVVYANKWKRKARNSI